MNRRQTLAILAAVPAMVAVGGCSSGLAQPAAVAPPPDAGPATGAPPTSAHPASTSTQPPPPASTTPPVPAVPPASPWRVGARPLPLRPDGYGQVLPTPAVLADRRLPTVEVLPPPAGSEFSGTISTVPSSVVARSTWHPQCPVRLDELRYLTVSFWGFDGSRHTGELLVNVRVAGAVVDVFRQLHQARFPIEEMRVATAAELTAAPTGDGNNTQSFVCRRAERQRRWSAHAFGLAIDLNPFCNPYSTGDLVLPELASAYQDRRRIRPGMVLPGDPTVRAFGRVGWTWGGNWSSPRDLMHFTATGN